MKTPIYVTQPVLPGLDDFIPYLKEIWDNKILTNGGPVHQRLEQELSKFLGVEYVSLFNNGTIALMAAIQSLGLPKGSEIITTPYSFVATAHSIVWNNYTPIFVDIDPTTSNLDPKHVERAITEKTAAILPVHCYGIPCDVYGLQAIAEKYQLKLIYDAAHAFGVKAHGKSVLSYGDLSVVSFHATKVFNTFEGGAIICHDLETKVKIDQLKNFGIVNETVVDSVGLNGKLSEIHSALGLLQLKSLKETLTARKTVYELYRSLLDGVEGIKCLERPSVDEDNYAYFPIIVEDGFVLDRDALCEKLKENNIYARKYFYPLISEFPVYEAYYAETPIAKELSDKVLCLPMYPHLQPEVCEYITNVIKSIK